MENWATVWDGCSPRGLPGCASWERPADLRPPSGLCPRRQQSRARRGQHSEHRQLPRGARGAPGRGGGGCGGGPAPGRSGLSPEGSGLSPLRPPRAGGSAAPSPPRRARTHLHIHNLICISTTSFAYTHFNICIDTPRRSPYLADVIPSRSPIGGCRAAGPPPYIGRAAGRLPRSALRLGGGTDQLQLPPPPPP